jgi:hypothetical protein
VPPPAIHLLLQEVFNDFQSPTKTLTLKIVREMLAERLQSFNILSGLLLKIEVTGLHLSE